MLHGLWMTGSEMSLFRKRLGGEGFEVESERVLDSRGPGDEASFEPDAHCPDYQTRVELHEAGSLWIRATKPA